MEFIFSFVSSILITVIYMFIFANKVLYKINMYILFLKVLM